MKLTTLRGWARRIFRPRPVELCPACGCDAHPHELRRLARERFAPGLSGVESLIAHRDYQGAAALDDGRAMGDLLVHELLRCGERVALITVQDPLFFEPRVRAATVLEGEDAAAAWSAAG